MLAKLKARLAAQGGFTLIELLVVVAIIAILITLAVPRVIDSINKSRQAQDDADMHSISLAAEQLYMTNSAYPKDVAATTWAAITGTNILKSSVDGINAFNKGYIYFTDTTGSFYVLVDPGNPPAAVTHVSVSCNSQAAAEPSITGAFQVVTTGLAASDVAKGCTATWKEDTTAKLHFVTN